VTAYDFSIQELDAMFNASPVPWCQEEEAVTIGLAEKITERHILTLLYARYSVVSGNGPRYVVAEHVRNDAGFDATRTCDFMAVDVWPSSGLPIHGFEVKTSRADWLRELADPSKAQVFMDVVDHWWLVAAPGVATRDELPPGWGMLVVSEKQRPRPTLFGPDVPEDTETVLGLRQVKAAPPLQGYFREERKPLPRGLMVALLRAAQKTSRRYG